MAGKREIRFLADSARGLNGLAISAEKLGTNLFVFWDYGGILITHGFVLFRFSVRDSRLVLQVSVAFLGFGVFW